MEHASKLAEDLMFTLLETLGYRKYCSSPFLLILHCRATYVMCDNSCMTVVSSGIEERFQEYLMHK